MVDSYDIVIVGGGLAGSTLARVLAERGIKVLVVEREKRFRDRVRGEVLLPWGVPDARELGVHERLTQSCGYEVRWSHFYSSGAVTDRRDFLATTPYQAGFLDFYHPEMQDTLLKDAEAAGAEVRRGAKVAKVTPGDPVNVTLQGDIRVQARLVVGADGRDSNVRKWGGFKVNRDPERIILAGVLLKQLSASEDVVHFAVHPPIGQIAGIMPIGRQRFRCYLMYARRDHYPPMAGAQRVPNFIAACIETGAPAEWFKEAQIDGPLATFEGAGTWVDYPYQNGVALVGDAAAASDPTWGWGLASVLRDVRLLRDQLVSNDDWTLAANGYAREHEQYHTVLHRLHEWQTDLWFALGAEADARRDRVFQLHQAEPDRAIDMFGVGPDSPNDKLTRSHFFGED